MSSIPEPHFQSTQPAAVLFDFDGTLVDSEKAYARLLVDALDSFDISLSEEEALEICWGRSWPKIYQHLLSRWPQIGSDYSEFLSPIRGKIAITGGFVGEPIGPSIELLRELAETVPVGVVTGSYRADVEFALESLSLSKYVSTIVGAEDYDKGKPDPEPYLLAASQVGVRPERCLAIEDAEIGIAAAKSAGMKCIAIHQRGKHLQADCVVESLNSAIARKFIAEFLVVERV